MSIRYRAFAVVSGLVLAVTLAACSSDHSAMDHSGAVTGDASFAQQMIPHHQQAVEMADLAQSRAGSAEVKALAQQIKSAQDPEIAQMRAWLSEWGAPEQVAGQGATPMGMNHTDMDADDMGGMTGMMSAEQMSALAAASGPEFDRMWLQMMIEHHEGAIAMANQVLTTTTDTRVKDLATAVVAGQTAEITEMRTLLE